MKKLHSFAFYALVTPALALSSGALLAQQSTGQNADREQQSTEGNQDAMKSGTKTVQSGQEMGDQKMGDQKMAGQSGMHNKGYMDAAPANGMHASDLIGAELKTTGDEDVGAVEDLIIDKSGQVVAVVVSVGGFLGMGEKNVAIAWDDVMQSGTSDMQNLRIDVTREELQSAPEYVTQE